MAKLTKRQKDAAQGRKDRILMLHAGGMVQTAIAKKCRCTQQYVSKVLSKERES